jgi:hypothetical protein
MSTPNLTPIAPMRPMAALSAAAALHDAERVQARMAAGKRLAAEARTAQAALDAQASLTGLALPRNGIYDHGLARVDDRGRVRHQELLDLLGWEAGQQVHLALGRTRLTVSVTEPEGVPSRAGRLDGRRRLLLPLAYRDMLAIAPGDPIVLSADPSTRLLVITSTHVLDEVIRRGA